MDKTIKVGLIGFGNGGQIFHAPFITAVNTLNLTKIRCTNPAHVALAKAQYPSAEIVAEASAIFNDAAIALVVITTPNTSHFSLAKEALQAGKNVVLDKPITINTIEADQLIALAAEKGLLLTVFHSRRLDSDFTTVQKLIAGGILGEVVELESRYDRFRNYLKPGAWREEATPGAGILYDLGSHLIDQALTLFGQPEAITADTRIQRSGGKVDDNFELILHYNTVKVTLKAGMLVRDPLPRFIVLGTEGTFIKYGLDVQEEALKAGDRPHLNKQWGVEPAAIWGKLNTTFNGLHFIGQIESEVGDYTRFYQNVSNALTAGEPLLVKAAEARNVIRIIELAMQSQEEKRTISFSH
ncbi:MAG: Gfo/Idh/MocA family oxidoreductase [Bacteroidota bacterium]